MKAKLNTKTFEIVIDDYSIVEDEGLCRLVDAGENLGYPELSLRYDDKEDAPGKYTIVIDSKSLPSLLKFLSFSEIRVKIIS